MNSFIALMYHRISDILPPGELIVPVKKFREQMQYLERYCEVVSINAIIDKVGRERFQAVPYNKNKPCVVITFDDGYKDNYLNAYPILKEFGLPAVIFLITGMIGTDKKRPSYKNNSSPDMLDWSEVEQMGRDGIAFGVHTVSHPHLSALNYEKQMTEIKNSIGALATSKLGVRAQVSHKPAFCYPYGDYNNDTLKILEHLGVEAAFTVKPGVNDSNVNLLELRRIGVSGLDSISEFKNKITEIRR